MLSTVLLVSIITVLVNFHIRIIIKIYTNYKQTDRVLVELPLMGIQIHC